MQLFCVISFFPFICAGMLSPSMTVCWEQWGRRGGLKQSGFTPGNGNAWIAQEMEMHEYPRKWKCMNTSVLSQTTPSWQHSVLWVLWAGWGSFFPKSPHHCQCLLQERPAQSWTTTSAFYQTLHSSISNRSEEFFGVGNPINGYSSLTLSLKTHISISPAWLCSCATSKVFAALLPSKTRVSSQDWQGDADYDSVFWIPKCYLFWGSLCWQSFLSKSICPPEFLILWFSDWRNAHVLYIGLDGCALCSPKLHSTFISSV